MNTWSHLTTVERRMLETVQQVERELLRREGDQSTNSDMELVVGALLALSSIVTLLLLWNVVR